ncbi:ATP phosphoribosyltransferase 1, chloroplastic [Capsicum baccatum]|uniref:ATP phosphoribosyltransferase 1, chloroplastic n=1 Tax=Capsicum baccatum TaxID=33114 RepID=A0A2G2WEA7_CAPBA|nr:ATP phosphoribosyltransferase 1, chloroplastic [Capsicum baccatum]
MSSSDSSFWKEEVNSEIDSILSNHTWELVDLPPGNKPLGSKWIFKRKMKTDGSIEKYKARLVVKGFNQKEGLDYFDTYSPVTRITSIRMLIALAAVYDLQIHQMDVKTAFLNGELEEEIYMEQPEGFVVPGKENKVCKLVKSLYGLKQAPKQWHAKFDQTMLANGFKINECDKCVYIKDTPNHQVIVCLYVDDMLIISRDICDINATKRMLESKFDMKDLGVADVILGIRIHRTPQGLALSQSHYIEKVLDKFKYMEFDIAKTPLDANFALRKNEGESDSQLEYARVLGCLMYIMNCTRPDIACTISKLSRYTSNPNKTHWMAMKRVLGYLKYTQDYALHYNKYPVVLEGYSDANWITGSNEVKSTSGYVFTIGGGAVSWKSSKQTCIARSTMESEFIALDKAGEEAEWLRNFLEDIPYWPKPVAPVCIHCDSQAAIGRAGSMMYNGKSRHIRRRHNTVRELLSSGIITIDYVKSKDNVSDPLTKGLSREGVERTSKGMGLRPRTSQHGVALFRVNNSTVSREQCTTSRTAATLHRTDTLIHEITCLFRNSHTVWPNGHEFSEKMGLKFLKENGLKHVILFTVDGAIEATPAIGIFDAIVDLASSGITLREYNLKEIEGRVIMQSQMIILCSCDVSAVLVAGKKSLMQRKGVLDITHEMLERLEAHFMVTINMRGGSVEEVTEKILSQTSLPGFQIKFHLGVLDLDVAVYSEKPTAITEASNDEEKSYYKQWDRSNRLGLMFMRMNIAGNIKTTLPKTESTKELLKLVEESSQTSDKSFAGTLMVTLTTIKFDGSRTMHEHVSEMTNIVARLKSLGME